MKKLLVAILTLACPLLSVAEVGNIQMNITSGITMSEVGMLYFSHFIVYGQADVTISPGGIRTSAGSVVFKDEFFAPANFSIKGAPMSVYKINLPASTTVTNSKTTLMVDGFSANNSTGSFGSDGKASVRIGATVHIPEGFTSGLYTGTYNITATYE